MIFRPSTPAVSQDSDPILNSTNARSIGQSHIFKSRGQAEDGSFNSRAGVGITALVTTGVLRHGRSPGDPLAAKSLKYLEDSVQSDGGIYEKDGMLPNYETCMVIMCLTEANKDNRYNGMIRNAEAFIRQSQWGETAGKDRSDLSYGGTGYGKDSRPDLSNTAYFIDALKGLRQGRRRSGNTKGPGFRFALPESRNRAQYHRRSPLKIRTAVFIIRAWPAAAARPAKPTTADCAATDR